MIRLCAPTHCCIIMYEALTCLAISRILLLWQLNGKIAAFFVYNASSGCDSPPVRKRLDSSHGSHCHTFSSGVEFEDPDNVRVLT